MHPEHEAKCREDLALWSLRLNWHMGELCLKRLKSYEACQDIKSHPVVLKYEKMFIY